MNWDTTTQALAWTWLAFGWLAFLYQFRLYWRTRAGRAANLSMVNGFIAEIESQKPALDRTTTFDLCTLYGRQASIQIVEAKSSTVTWAHAFLVGAALVVLWLSYAVETVSMADGVLSFFAVTAIALTGRLVWLTWYSAKQYKAMVASISQWRLIARR